MVIKSPMIIMTVKEHTGKTITEGGVIASRSSLIARSQKRIITGYVS